MNDDTLRDDDIESTVDETETVLGVGGDADADDLDSDADDADSDADDA